MPGSRERTTRREVFRFKTADESYGVVRAALGDGRFRVEADGTIVVARIRGNMRDRVIVRVGDVVLIDGDQIVKKYSPAEVQMLKDNGEFTVSNEAIGGDADTGFDFEAI
jgi:initiation factor 1A